MALNSLFCADVPLSNYSLSRGNGGFYRQLREVGLEVMCVCVCVCDAFVTELRRRMFKAAIPTALDK